MGVSNMHKDWRKASRLVILGLAAASIGGASQAAEKPAKLEPIPGSDLKRVILTPKAAQRLAIATVEIGEEPVLRWLMVEGKVEAAPVEVATAAASPAQAAAAGARVHLLEDPTKVLADPNKMQHSRVIVSLKDEDEDLDDDDDDDADDVTKDQDKAKADEKAKAKERPPVVVVPIGKARAPRLPATPVRVAGVGDAAKVTAAAPGSMSQDYEVMKPDHKLRPGQRVYARILHPDSGKPQKVVPYSAVFYDTRGNTWTYTNPEPLVFVRHRIEVESVSDNRAVLREGPPIGTKIVTAGAPELMGVEQKFGQ
jgi:hypothetical protein